MARTVAKLSAATVRNAKERGYYSDGGGVYLQVSVSGSKSWVFRYKTGLKLYEMGLGPLHTMGLAEARQRRGRPAQADSMGSTRSPSARQRSKR
jgi:hypothetical protein